jgi:DNA-binding MarR family transcriptional regulator
MDPYRNFGFVLKDIGRLYTRRFEERAKELALTLVQCKALAFLARNEGISQKRLAELIDIDPMSLVRILDRMEADGWVERRSDPEDRRARSLRVTERAKPLVDHIWHLAAETRAEALQGLSDAERATLMELMERVQANLQALTPLVTEELSAASPLTAGAVARKTGRTLR